jgi:hypothetical protein
LKDPTTLTDDNIAGLKSNITAWRSKKDLERLITESRIKATTNQLRLVTEQVKAFHKQLLTEDPEGWYPSVF